MGRFGTEKPDYPWEDGDKDLIIKLLAEGLSSSQIADAFPVRTGIRPTRNSIIGKIDRWGLRGKRPTTGLNASRPARPRKFEPSPPKAIAIPVSQPSPPKAIAPAAPSYREKSPSPPKAIAPALMAPEKGEGRININVEEFNLSPGGKAVIALKNHECKWPVGDPRASGFHFCCAPRVEDRPYCQHHLFERAAEPGQRVGWWKPGRRK